MRDEPPTDLHEPMVLRDGRTLVLRPLLVSDEDAYRTFTRTVSARAQYYRFFSPRRDLSDKEINHFVHVDFVDRLALVAVDGEDVVAVARYDREVGSDRAEVAFIVMDDYQGHGIALRLLRLLARGAAPHGIHHFFASVLADNEPMLRVFAKSGWVTNRRFLDGALHVVLDITEQGSERESESEIRADADTGSASASTRASTSRASPGDQGQRDGKT